MDSVVSSAVEEICLSGVNGISLSSLFSKLNLSPNININNNNNNSFKQSLYQNLLNIPSLNFLHDDVIARTDVAPPPLSCRFEDAERIGVRIVGSEEMRDNFLGLYDAPNIKSMERKALQRLSRARTNGITQNELAKEFNMNGKNLFYILKVLESQRLIVRQPAVVRTKEPDFGQESKNASCVTTNMVYLSRYAKHLGTQQKIEINKQERSFAHLVNLTETAMEEEDAFCGVSIKEDVFVKDYLPAMEAVCDKLKEADGKVLVVSDIKRDLGYVGSSSGHKAWRNICCRLKDAGLVEEFDARVNEKVERCLRLIKEFSQKNYESKLLENSSNGKHQMKFGRKPKNSDQVVELPIENQIYDMIDAEGPNGLTLLEVCERLGIDKKKNYARFCNMISRFGMHVQAENYKKTPAYRVWTSKNPYIESSSVFSNKLEVINGENIILNVDHSNLGHYGIGAKKFPAYNQSTFEGGGLASPEKWDCSDVDGETLHGSPRDSETNHSLLCRSNLLKPPQEQGESGTGCEGELALVSTEKQTNGPSSETGFSIPSKPVDSGVNQAKLTADAARRELALVSTEIQTNGPSSETRFSIPSKPVDSGVNQAKPRQPLTADAARREQQILEWLQDKKFILRCEMLRWLINLEKDKGTTIDKKTVDRIVNRLQQQGHCKCMHINVPSATNCGRSRITQVVLHQSVPGLSPELVSELHDRLRFFEMQSRSQSSYKCKNTDSVPTLDGVQRTTQNNQSSDASALRAEVMRANGFVLSKMVRAKLLHLFLWDYLSSLPGWGDSEKNKNCSNGSCNIFKLELAVKAIPLELFLQVVGSTQKFGDMVEKCKKGLCLSDLPVEEYKIVMDINATARLSKVIDILRRLKLIRLVTNGPVDDEVKVSLTHLTHAMELKTYIEEPVSVLGTSVNGSVDLRPRIRHDFALLNKEAVVEYWQTLEYCYAATDPRAAVHAFPGSSVQEVFLFRSWSSIRVMTADQRAKLLKCITKENTNEKLTFQKCRAIAKDLNLTLEQVLRMYYDKRQKRLDRFEDGHMEAHARRKRKRTRKSKRSLEESSVMAARADNENREADTTNKTVDRLDSSGEHDAHLSSDKEDEHIKTVGEEMGGTSESEEGESNEPRRQRRFSWSYEADRQLLIQYIRHRVVRGAKFNRANWSSLQNLPAHPSTCARRMSSLKRDKVFRKAVMKLCNMLSQRYAQHLQRQQNDDVRTIPLNGSSQEDHSVIISENPKATCSKDEVWDDFEDKNIKRALEHIIQLKHIATLEAPKRMVTAAENCSDLNMDAKGHNLEGSESVLSATPSENIQNLNGGQHSVSARRSRSRHFHQKFIKLLNAGTSITRQVHESLAVSNAIELYKLVFLSTSSAPDLPKLLAETLRRYSEHDLFAAFSYLRDKKIMIGGSGGSPFILSQHFLHSICKSPFPSNTGKRAAEFARWLNEKKKNNLYKPNINLAEDIQCGDIFQLFSLVSAGELSISPHLPKEGVGEAEESRGSKRRNEDINTLSDCHSPKKMKSFCESELICRREKGFPGIMLAISHAGVSIDNALELFKDNENSSSKLDGSVSTCSSTKKILDLDNVAPTGGIQIVGNHGESSWESMAGYAEYLMKNNDNREVGFLSPDIFRAAYAAIQKAGDQGLSLNEIAQVVNVPVEKMAEYIVDVLHAFRRVMKVNGYDSVQVVDSLYRSKYFLTSMTSCCQSMNPSSLENSRKITHKEIVCSNSQSEVSMNVDDVHKVTILNLPEEGRNKTMDKGCMQEQDVTNNNVNPFKQSSSEPHIPILPWVNGNGTTNKLVYNGLIRRVLGIVMQNPGMLENDIITQMDALNPQNCRKLLQLMTIDKHLITREMGQSTSVGPPALLESLLWGSFSQPKMVYRQHFFANPGSSHLL
ncbi:hypothetical protein ACFE04_001722 [Oxalis oulophora]